VFPTAVTPAQVAVPGWLLAGVVLGGIFGALILGAFLAGERLFPTPNPGGGPDSQPRVETIRREEIRYYLDAIGEAFEEDATTEGRTVAFLLPERDVAVTFDARTYLLLEDSPVHPILVEHEMPGVHLGTRLPFETPDLGFGPDSEAPEDAWDETRTRARAAASGAGRFEGGRDWRAGDRAVGPDDTDAESVRTAYATLGLPPGADADSVRSAYRQRVKEVHPDQGGDPDAFQRLQEAYAVVEDDLDADGQEPEPEVGGPA
jgi:hypothetical protein